MRSRPRAALASGVIVLLAMAALGVIGSPPSAAQSFCFPPDAPYCQETTSTTVDPTTTTVESTPPSPAWADSKWTSPPVEAASANDSTFRGTFVHHGPGKIDKIDMTVNYTDPQAFPAACGPAPGPLESQHPAAPADDTGTSTADFLFEVGLACNGIYDVVPTADLDFTGPDSTFSMPRNGLRIAVPPQQPPSFVATDNGNQTVTLTWQAPDDRPPDLIGYRLSRSDAAGRPFAVMAQTDPGTLSFADTNIPAGGGSFFYQVQTVRNSPNGVLLSPAVQTSGALTVGPVGSPGGGSVKGAVTAYDPGSGGTGSQTFDPATLPGDAEPGDENPVLPNVPGAQTVQRFVDDHGGAGLVTPVAGALNLGVWAALLLFLTRRAASAERAMLVSVELEDVS